MKIENKLPRYVRIKYMEKVKNQRVTKTVEFTPAVNEIDADDYKAIKDTPAYQGYIKRGEFVEIKGPGSAAIEAVKPEEIPATTASTSYPILGSGLDLNGEEVEV